MVGVVIGRKAMHTVHATLLQIELFNHIQISA
jgi:hypothetical protein